jgi:hypothetical protein
MAARLSVGNAAFCALLGSAAHPGSTSAARYNVVPFSSVTPIPAGEASIDRLRPFVVNSKVDNQKHISGCRAWPTTSDPTRAAPFGSATDCGGLVDRCTILPLEVECVDFWTRQ